MKKENINVNSERTFFKINLVFTVFTKTIFLLNKFTIEKSKILSIEANLPRRAKNLTSTSTSTSTSTHHTAKISATTSCLTIFFISARSHSSQPKREGIKFGRDDM